MISIYNIKADIQELKTDLAGEFPLYIYLDKVKNKLLYSDDILELLEDSRIEKPLKVSEKGLSFLLQSGVVPLPHTIYENIFILGIGDSARIFTKDEKISIEFNHVFPFKNENRLKELNIDEELIFDLIADATISRIDDEKDTFLFHSAGKDSNTIALALAKAGYQDNVTLITHKSKGNKDESEISNSIAKKLGFKHQVLHEVDVLGDKHKESIVNFFKNSPFPSTDNVTLAYPLYTEQIPKLKKSNIIDGGGNDTYMMTPPSSRDVKILPISKYTSYLSVLRSFVNSESFMMKFLRTPPEWFGMSGLSYKDSKSIYHKCENVYNHWSTEFKKRKKWDLFDSKTDLYTTITVAEIHIRKARNFAHAIESNLILPFSNKKVAKYFSKMPEKYLFDRKLFKNKLILRDILKKEISLDSDAIGKLGFSYDSGSILLNNLDWMKKEILECNYWDKKNISKFLRRIEKNKNLHTSKGSMSRNCIYRLYLVSGWLNNNKYIN
ncbi:MAG: hypothetical protein HWD89_09115 [Tenacibaculum sp.]|nr:hypothetical protein [Tenacibaculum sp.]